MITILDIMFVLVVHFVADFVLQSHWMASNKSKMLTALSAHIITYGSFLMVSAIIYFVWIKDFSYQLIVSWVFCNAGLHMLTDAISSRVTSKLWAKGSVHNFFVVIGLDQLVHYVTLFGSLYLIYYGKM